MASLERKIFVPDGDTNFPHPDGVCKIALRMRDEILKKEDSINGETPRGRCLRKFGGCLIEIIPRKKTENTPL